ncbi:hypothetical protein DL96DRAFT_1590927 [Flagelloscypha sp. PMI_526]|nr:hypothetical protein DL96DRAFT_1590927 [Flagelloscypha sp. PMI_526]
MSLCCTPPFPEPLSMSREELQTVIIAECEKHRKENRNKFEYRACIYIGTTYFVKYGSQEDLEPERATHQFIFDYAQQSNKPDAPRIANIIHHFVDQRMMYLVMEYIKLKNDPLDLAERIPQVVKWLSEVPPPPNSTLGPVGGGRIHHKFFKVFQAPYDFPNIEKLDQYVKKAFRLLPGMARRKLPPVDICGERLMFTQSDMDKSNFGVDEHGQTVFMDFGDVGLLPETFVAYTLCSGTMSGPIAYSDSIAASLGLSDNSNMRTMTAIAQCLWMVANPRLGLE